MTLNLTGKAFGRLTVIGKVNTVSKGLRQRLAWSCQCSCGNKVNVRTDRLTAGHTQSCGCISVERGKQIMAISSAMTLVENRRLRTSLQAMCRGWKNGDLTESEYIVAHDLAFHAYD